MTQAMTTPFKPTRRWLRRSTEHKPLDLFEVVESQRHADLTARQLRKILAGMPLPAPDEISRPSVEVDGHLEVVGPAKDGKAAFQIIVRVEIGRWRKSLRQDLDIGHPCQSEGPQGVASQIEGEQVPMAFDAGKVTFCEARNEVLNRCAQS